MLKTFILCMLTCFPLALNAAVSEGEGLENQMWVDIKAHNWVAVQSKLAPYFQSIHTDGARTREQELALIKQLNISDYTISDFQATGGTQSTIILTYNITISETIDKERLVQKTSPRMSVWQNINGVWQWIAHANLVPVSQ